MTTTHDRWHVVAVCALISVSFPCGVIAQGEKPWQLPQLLRPTLESRVRLFTAAQADGRWSDVALLLGAYRRGSSGYMRYTPAHKACLISQMQATPMIEFTYSIQESPFSSEILSTPPGRRWWALVGEGLFREGAREIRRRSFIIAYRDNNDWFFAPQGIDDEAWARAHMSADEIAADRKDRVKMILGRDCPVEIVDLHVLVDPDNLSSRLVTFRLHNKTGERITNYSFEIGNDYGSISTGSGNTRDEIEPHGTSRKWEQEKKAYIYWCDGESKMWIVIHSVRLASGRIWNAPATAIDHHVR